MDQRDSRNEQEIKEAEVKLEEKLTDEEMNQVAGGKRPGLAEYNGPLG